MKFRQLVFLLLFLIIGTLAAQAQQIGDVYVDDNGLMRWGHNDTEVQGFGVNYTVPFAHAYRTAGKLEVDLKKAIDNDVYHFSRLGFDLFRVHVWDTEISDAEGNLLENEHLELFDYLLKKLKERNINFVITPIAFWGNGWPEPDEETPGFSHKFGKEKSLTDPEAIEAQENYLAQFLNHVNPYTGVAYKEEPNLIAFEISNEPHHRGEPAEVTEFIKKMVTAMRSTGTKKPIFYNVSHSIHLAEAYFDAGIQGGTFQWYPTGLGFGKELAGNLLPNVNRYDIPFDSIFKKNKAAKLVYEFDAADVNKSYIYPAMARSFRESGIQIATHFAYDPTFMAFANTEYNTHYMNLAYTPQKALALMISSEVFHRIPMNKNFGTYPENLEFNGFKVDYEKDLAELNSTEKFIYTNTTSAKPKSLKTLMQIAGFGDSEIVKYEGKGAYFLDKLETGVWRLEVMPDAILMSNPFGKNSLDKKVAVINWKEWKMKLNLPDLGENFSIKALNKGNDFSSKAESNSFNIQPGVYLLTKKGVTATFKGNEEWSNIKLNEFSAPEGNVKKTYLVHEALSEIVENSDLEISAKIVSNENIEKVEAWLLNGNTYENVELKRKTGYVYSAEIPLKVLHTGYLSYRIIITTAENTFTFPSGIKGNPGEWNFYDESNYVTRILKENSLIYIFNAAQDSDHLVKEWKPGNQLVPGKSPGEVEYQIKIARLFQEDAENKNAKPVYDYSFRFNFSEKIKGRSEELNKQNKLILKARSLSGKTEKIQVALVDKNGSSFGKIIEITTEKREYTIDLSELKPVKTVTLPRPYPGFLPYYFEHNNQEIFNLENIESIQFSIGPGLEKDALTQKHEIGIISVRLEEE
ncbi:MAG: hypothetical protein JJE07_06455 [Flavobacteriaceae bacterium]|nr:hypothetical protein [Flavobacteriaceae bacterium]